MIPCVLSIAGSDSSGGAGIQADIKAMTALGVYAETAITALTAQNTQGVQGVLPTSPEFISQQIESVFSDIRPDAVKIGMLPNEESVCAVARALRGWQAEHVVLDPVMVATSGASLSEDGAVAALKKELLPLAEVITPNIPEAQVLSGVPIETEDDMVAAGVVLCNRGAKAVLVKGGHLHTCADDVLVMSEDETEWFRASRVKTDNTHGTGCTLSSAIAAYLAKGLPLTEAVARAKRYLTGALIHDLDLGEGPGPVNHMWAYGTNG
ncbi:MAG: bifunctional hydroxymethylpyrimidine kinase/phosphomethylpyrimidine kinase [Eggerthellaceae bacterium]|nr:bifunctional hydroxymethylpyrimidine kinase/phosphomethylpyrimidine kinase [Eggerthellaceae bacterium]